MKEMPKWKAEFFDDVLDGEWARLFKITVPGPIFKFIVFCDWHAGNETCCYSGIEHLCRYVEKEGLPWVSLGDLVENSLRESAGSVFEQNLMPHTQEKYIKDLLYPIRNQCLGMIEGNHEYRSKRASDQSIAASLADKLGIADRYFHLSWEGIVSLDLRTYEGSRHPITWTLLGVHGTGGGYSPGASLNAIHKTERVYEGIDLTICGHSHRDSSDSTNLYGIRMNERMQSPKQYTRQKFFQVCGAAMQYRKSYAQRKALPASAREQFIIEIGCKRMQRVVSDKKIEIIYKYKNSEAFPLI